MEHQNWTPTILHSKNAQSHDPFKPKEIDAAKVSVKKSQPNKLPLDNRQVYKIMNSEETKIETVPKDIYMKIQQARTAKKLKQKDLAISLNCDVGTIQNIESGKAIYNKQQIAKIYRALGIQG